MTATRVMARPGVWLVGLLALVGASCGGSESDATDQPTANDGLRIASFDFPESVMLAELYAQAAESSGIPVVRLGVVGPREIMMPALQLDLVDLVPEYLGTALRWLGAEAPSADTAAAADDLDARLDPLGLTALDVAPAENKNVIVVGTTVAERHHLESISDLHPLALGLRFGGPAECPDRPLCLIGLEEVYGLRFAEFVAQRSARFTAEALRRDEIDAGLMFSTDPVLSAPDLTVLADDLGLQPAENIVPVVRSDALARWGPGLATALDAVSSELGTDILQDLNREIEDAESVEMVVRDWLEDIGMPDSAMTSAG